MAEFVQSPPVAPDQPADRSPAHSRGPSPSYEPLTPRRLDGASADGTVQSDAASSTGGSSRKGDSGDGKLERVAKAKRDAADAQAAYEERVQVHSQNLEQYRKNKAQRESVISGLLAELQELRAALAARSCRARGKASRRSTRPAGLPPAIQPSHGPPAKQGPPPPGPSPPQLPPPRPAERGSLPGGDAAPPPAARRCAAAEPPPEPPAADPVLCGVSSTPPSGSPTGASSRGWSPPGASAAGASAAGASATGPPPPPAGAAAAAAGAAVAAAAAAPEPRANAPADSLELELRQQSIAAAALAELMAAKQPVQFRLAEQRAQLHHAFAARAAAVQREELAQRTALGEELAAAPLQAGAA
eukprot:TRINITY_DN10601_c0_g2_i1.p1 TRINITY_DN10601_c0_g2~~TRINITY_DN10601_c0_g2_i1.p1  ORF type:complete len:383 (+),score=76.78 TRINITY_DN10601_c0_g2_i1:75-1151(+)